MHMYMFAHRGYLEINHIGPIDWFSQFSWANARFSRFSVSFKVLTLITNIKRMHCTPRRISLGFTLVLALVFMPGQSNKANF